MAATDSTLKTEDLVLQCKDCPNTFVLTAGEQQYYHSVPGLSLPKRCKDCRAMRKAAASQNGQMRPAPAAAPPVYVEETPGRRPQKGGGRRQERERGGFGRGRRDFDDDRF
jgi:hypothetical protein